MIRATDESWSFFIDVFLAEWLKTLFRSRISKGIRPNLVFPKGRGKYQILPAVGCK